MTAISHELFQRACLVMPGGVNSPARSCLAVGGKPVVIERGDGAYMWDVDGNRYIDYVGSWGAMILGHRHPAVLNAVAESAAMSTSFGALCRAEIDMAELICSLVPGIDMVRMVCSGTEATMSAVRLARAFTGGSLLIKFDGCYHGHADSFLVKAGSGLATLGIASCPGVPDELSRLTISLPFNDLPAVEAALSGRKAAAVIVEPVVGNAGVILPEPGYLEGLRRLCTKYGALLIFDEVMTGFRVARGGAQERFNIEPDLTCLGKIIGGGLPVGAYGGRAEIMEFVAPTGPVYQAGTLAGNPLSMQAGLAQVRQLEIPGTYDKLDQATRRLVDGLKKLSAASHFQVSSITGMVTVFFTGAKVFDFTSAQTADTAAFSRFWQAMLARGIYWPPSQFESAFISLAHCQKDIDDTLSAFEDSFNLSLCC